MTVIACVAVMMLVELGLKNIYHGTPGICLIEWPERIAAILPETGLRYCLNILMRPGDGSFSPTLAVQVQIMLEHSQLRTKKKSLSVSDRSAI
jgi:tRNA A37 threonylcarbamoyladenosine biosynthesis protein TsaE